MNAANISGIYLDYDTVNGASQPGLFTPGMARNYIGIDNVGYNYGGIQRMTSASIVPIAHSAKTPAPGSFIGINAKLARSAPPPSPTPTTIPCATSASTTGT